MCVLPQQLLVFYRKPPRFLISVRNEELSHKADLRTSKEIYAPQLIWRTFREG
jgi:hypothetical protein